MLKRKMVTVATVSAVNKCMRQYTSGQTYGSHRSLVTAFLLHLVPHCTVISVREIIGRTFQKLYFCIFLLLSMKLHNSEGGVSQESCSKGEMSEALALGAQS